MAKKIKKLSKKLIALICMITLVFTASVTVNKSEGAALDNRNVTISDSAKSKTAVDYDLLADFSGTTIYCIQAVFCTTATGACTGPTGLTTASADKGDAGNWAGFVYANWTGAQGADTKTAKLTNAAGAAGSAADSVVFGNITNSSVAGTYYARVTTYTNVDCATGPTDTGIIPFAILDDTSGVTVSATIDEYLTFTSDDYSMNFGSWTGGATDDRWATAEVDTGSSVSNTDPVQFTISTNAADGVSVTARSTGSGAAAGLYNSTIANLIAADNAGDIAAGSEGYALYTSTGTTLTENTFADQTATGIISTSAQQIAYTNTPVSSGIVEVALYAAIAATTEAGSYSDTLTFVATPTF